MNRLLSFFVMLVTTTVLTACGGGGSSSTSDTRARINGANVEDLAISATSALEQARNGNSLPTLTSRAAVESITSTRLAAATEPCPGDGAGGTYTVNTSGDTTTITYNCTNPTLSGTATITFSPNATNPTSFTIEYQDFLVGTDSFSATFTCTDIQASFNCSYSINGLTGYDNGSFSISGASISGSDSSGYNGSITVTDDDHGSVTITVNDVRYTDDCSPGLDVPTSGTVTLSGSGGSSATLVFQGCNQATVTVDGVGYLIDWTAL